MLEVRRSNMPSTTRTIFLFSPILALAATASQPSRTEPQERSALAGPRVEIEQARVSLVKRGFNGRVERLETSPEEAALAVLVLSENEKKLTCQVLSERAAIIDQAVASNIPLLLKLQGFRDADRSERLALLREWSEALRPLRAHGSLADELAACLSPANAASMKTLAKEYNEALLEEASRSPGNAAGKIGSGPRSTRAQALAAERLLGLGLELKRSYDRIVAARAARLDETIKLIEATPEQEERIRAIALEFAQQSLGQPTPALQRDFVRRLTDVLTPPQRVKLLTAGFGK